ncbi:alpha-galactosidase [Gryllotalpicola reticulitermitis]|uniref:alpha-galactosidase n=1 Tax=Gryllotalpicola reticulitermitis TaxID=1184153 RepID=A0ABV8QEF7_9MICO
MSLATPRRPFLTMDAHGTQLVLEIQSGSLPSVLHWGPSLGTLDDAALHELSCAADRQTPPGTLDAAWQVPLVPQESDGWAGRPALLATRRDTLIYPRWTVVGIDGAEDRLSIHAVDDVNGLRLKLKLQIQHGGLLSASYAIANTGNDELGVEWLEATLPVPKTADTLTEFSGRWTREKVPYSQAVPRGATIRQSRRGRDGHDAPTLAMLSIGNPLARSGRIWAVHTAWSADVSYRVDRLPENTTILGAGELLRPGEIVLAPDESYTAPTTHFAFSDTGLDGISAQFYRYLRSRPQHPHSPRPLVLNTWEAVYFDHKPAELVALAELAASVGIERFVLDDGWFLGRRDDTRGLGDWMVDPAVWPDGLEPLAARVHDLGMQFGLWFEPEMVNLDSDLARSHPDWLLHNPAHLAAPARLSWRSQYVLDIANMDAFAHVLRQMDVLIAAVGIDFIKWDHNRDLIEPVHAGRPGTHVQTRAMYALMAELKRRHPGLEIESCSSGGARSDLGVLEIADRVWASDSNDAVERQDIQRWTQLLLPPELVGAHVGPTESHSSGRVTDLSYRLATSLMGSAGFEWNIAGCSREELATITRFAALYRELRPVIHSGDVVHADLADPALRFTGAVARDRSSGVFTIATVASLEDSQPERVPLPGLDPRRRYRVKVRDEIGAARYTNRVAPPWLTAGITLSGRALSEFGLQIPALWPAQALVVHAVAEDADAHA